MTLIEMLVAMAATLMLMAAVAQAFSIFGKGISGSRAALDTLLREEPQLLTVNLGSGQGHSVLDVVHAFEAACGHRLPYELVARRPGDAATTVADPGLASERLDWRTRRSLADICRDGWAWQSANPRGYGP